MYSIDGFIKLYIFGVIPDDILHVDRVKAIWIVITLCICWDKIPVYHDIIMVAGQPLKQNKVIIMSK